MRILLLCLTLGLAATVTAPAEEHVILCGGPTLRKWENLRVQGERHDQWWANFIRASTLRMVEIRRAYGPEANLVWIVYRPGYALRGQEDGKPYTTWIQEQATKRNCQLVWVSTGGEAIRALNARPTGGIRTFDYFGHSNRHCFMLDYGSTVMAASQAWIHEKDLPQIRRSIFAKNAVCQSYGCHTGESMSAVWNKSLGARLIGARGKTDYAVVSEGRLPTVSGSWVR
ncbi:MAG: hypothetical protein O3A92_04105 [Verrucomicrobia bacterium]|nr:hypothetical protein [Verrucomicrobiota bacterium]